VCVCDLRRSRAHHTHHSWRNRRPHRAGHRRQSRRSAGHQRIREVAGRLAGDHLDRQWFRRSWRRQKRWRRQRARPGGTPAQRWQRSQREQRPLSPSRPFILRPVATSLLMAAIMLVGIVAYTQLPVSALPQVDYPTIQILTYYPGASPEVMATTVTAPLERQCGELQGLSQMTSTSSAGNSVIVLQFDLALK